MKRFLLTFTIASGLFQAQGQYTYNYLKAADDYFKKQDFYSASQYYEKYLAGDNKNTGREFEPYAIQVRSFKTQAAEGSFLQAVYHLAESYRLLNYHEKAEAAYRKVLEMSSTAFPLARFHYARSLHALQKFDTAEKEYNDFILTYQPDDLYKEAANNEIQNLRFIRSELNKKDLHLYSVNKTPLNAEGATYAPVLLNSLQLIFTSTRPDSSTKKQYTNRLYQATLANGHVTNFSRLDLSQDKETHQGVATLSADGKTMLFSRWTVGKGSQNASIYRSRLDGTRWSEPEKLNELVNAAGFNNQQPYLMPDGKHLLFASDRPNGVGGFDLWYATLDGSANPVRVDNMGPVINTKFDDQAPYYHMPSGQLVFSSKGRVGMGGYDFFSAEGTFGNWKEPRNFGYPVNSVKDDIYFASAAQGKNILENVFFSSDRSAACCLELFAASKARPVRQIRGLVLSCNTNQPLQGATVEVIDPSSNQVVERLTTGADGSYAFTLKEFQPVRVNAASRGYQPATRAFDAPEDPEAVQFTHPSICLDEVPAVGEVVVLENVYYEFNKATLLDESAASLDKLVALMKQNPGMVIEISGHTDDVGSKTYNQRLSEARAKSVVDYLAAHGIERTRMQAKGYGASRPVAPNRKPDGSDNPEGREKNRRTEFKVLKN